MKIFKILKIKYNLYLVFVTIILQLVFSSEDLPSLKDYPSTDTLIPISSTDVIIDDMLQAFVYYTNTEIYQKTEEPCQTLMTYPIYLKKDYKTCSCYTQKEKSMLKSGYCYSSYTKQQLKCDPFPTGFITLEYATNNCGYNESSVDIKSIQTNCYGYSTSENKAYLLDISGTVIMKEIEIKPLSEIQDKINELKQLSFCRENEDKTYPIPEKSILFFKNDNNQYITTNRHYAFQNYNNLIYYASKKIKRTTENDYTTVSTLENDYDTSGLQVNDKKTTVLNCVLNVGFYKYSYLSEKCPDIIEQNRFPFSTIPTNEYNMYVRYRSSTRVYSVINKITSWDIIGYDADVDISTRSSPCVYLFTIFALFLL